MIQRVRAPHFAVRGFPTGSLEGWESMRAAVAVLVIVTLYGCAEPEESVKYYDSHVYDSFIEKLDAHGVKYRKGNDLSVFYPLSESRLVEAAADEIKAEYYPACGASFTSREKQNAMELALTERGISYNVVEFDTGPAITCAPEDREAVSAIFQSVLRGDRDQ